MRLTTRDTRKLIADNCFRVLGLHVEEQNEVEVIKPLLDELDVMRLCVELGMMKTQVTRRDFEHRDLLRADDFDQDFVRFLKHELFGGQMNDAVTSKIEVTSVIGRQDAVKVELTKMQLWSSEMDKNLVPQEEGIFVVLTESTTVEGLKELLFFSWIQDVRFQPAKLRDSATYVVRFLTQLSNHVICCLSAHDVAQLEKCVGCADDTVDDEESFANAGSYAVDFQVEKQEQETDGVVVNDVQQVDLGIQRHEAMEMRLVGGSFPAIAITKLAPRSSTANHLTLEFPSLMEFGQWLTCERERSAVKFAIGFHLLSRRVLEVVLQRMDGWPERQVAEVEQRRRANMVELESEVEDLVASSIGQKRDQILAIATGAMSVSSTKPDDKLQSLKGLIHELKSTPELKENVWCRLAQEKRVTLFFPCRLQGLMEHFCALFHASEHDALEKHLKEILVTPRKNLSFVKKPWWSRVVGAVGRLTGARTIDDAFIRFMNERLVEFTAKWWNVVDEALTHWGEYSKQTLKLIREQPIKNQFDVELDSVLHKAMTDLTHEHVHPDGDLVTVNCVFEAHGGVMRLGAEKRVVDPSSQLVELIRVEADGWSTKPVGYFAFNVKSKEIVGMFSVKTSAFVVVMAMECITEVSLVSCRNSNGFSREAEPKLVRRFPTKATLCDFYGKDRTLGFVVRNEGGLGDLVLYRFDQTFRKLEPTRTLHLDVNVTLPSPIKSILLLENAVFLTDQAGHVQKLNIRTRQISRTTTISSERDPSWTSSMFSLLHEMVVGVLLVKQNSNGTLQWMIESISCSDQRHLPSCPVQATQLEGLSPNVSVICIDGQRLLVLDRVNPKVLIVELDVHVRSDAFLIRHSDQKADSHNIEAGGDEARANHWLWVFYHLFEKFPVAGMLEYSARAHDVKIHFSAGLSKAFTSNSNDSVRGYMDSVMKALRKQNKPLGKVDFVGDSTFGDGGYFSRCRLGDLVEKLVTFVPVQICRAESNELRLMEDGQAKTGDETALTCSTVQLEAVDVAKSIRFGLLSPFLEAWRGKCVVITSMGKQSTGKSYFLNHLAGTSFAIAGSRCTDGAWMSLKVLPDNVLLVVLDFEGLGSFERSEQEDIFLSVLNASISHFTIFRMEMRFDKEIDELFARFQKGVQLIKGDRKLFRGKLYMSVKDVNPDDRRGVVDEFLDKFRKLIGANKERNFLTEMYRGQLKINCSPPFRTKGYYASLVHAKQEIEEKLCQNQDPNATFVHGKAFLDCIRMVLAKISILDWTALDEGTQQLQLLDLKKKVAGLLRTGAIVPSEWIAQEVSIPSTLYEPPLTSSNDPVTVEFEQVCDYFPEFAGQWKALRDLVDLEAFPDETLDVGFDCTLQDGCETVRVTRFLVDLFNEFVLLRGLERSKWGSNLQSDFDALVLFVVHRRQLKVMRWVGDQLDGKANSQWNPIERQLLSRFVSLFKRCLHKCSQCRMGCMKPDYHDVTEGHSCGMDHICRGICDYCSKRMKEDVDIVDDLVDLDDAFAFETDSEDDFATSLDQMAPGCSNDTCHEGLCECSEGDHTCKLPCSLIQATNCDNTCTLKSGHEGDHKCSVRQHECGRACVAVDCSGMCCLSIETEHSVHKCKETRCMQACVMEGCTERCSANDHFHGHHAANVAFAVEHNASKQELMEADSDVPVVHMCNKRHTCQALCEEQGMCDQKVHLKKTKKTFAGARSAFEYTLQEMNGVRKTCSAMLEPGHQTHAEGHSCIMQHQHHEHDDDDEEDKQGIHYCEARCPCCRYYCHKPFGHDGFHSTSHGNMRSTYFLSDTKEIDVGDRKYEAGEQGIAEMCALYCKKMGRGHVHYLECDKTANQCVYNGAKDGRRHCTRSLNLPRGEAMDEVLHDTFWQHFGWEDPCLDEERQVFGKCGFQCDAPEHDSQDTKRSYCLGDAWHADMKGPDGVRDGYSYVNGHKFECSHLSSGGKYHHVFVLDCSGSMSGQPWKDLLGAWNEYIQNRLSDQAPDIVSVVTFDHEGSLEFEGQAIGTVANRLIGYRGGGTCYNKGLQLANEVLSRNNYSDYKPVVLFFSDGQPVDAVEGERMASHIRESYGKYGLEAFAVGFGHVNLSVLKRVAAKMGGKFFQVFTGNELRQQFYTISASLGTRAGLAVAKDAQVSVVCPICQSELTHEDARVLQPCGHRLHPRCEVQLRNKTKTGEVVKCPECRKAIQ